ncbi:MAG: hypothetical protein AAF483_07425 [Planctomycetota bacterium]
MNRLSWLQKLYWTQFGKPVSERSLIRFLIQNEISSILEVGMGNCQRIRRIAKLAQSPTGVEKIRYIGTDEFEAAADPTQHLTLKHAHQVAGSLGFKASLIPGDVGAAVPRVAHKMGASDVIIIDGGMNPEAPENGTIGPWLNRLAHQESAIFACSETGQDLVLVDSNRLELSIPKAA